MKKDGEREKIVSQKNYRAYDQGALSSTVNCTLKLLLKPEMSQNRAQASKNAKLHTLEVVGI